MSRGKRIGFSSQAGVRVSAGGSAPLERSQLQRSTPHRAVQCVQRRQSVNDLRRRESRREPRGHALHVLTSGSGFSGKPWISSVEISKYEIAGVMLES